MSHQRMSGVSGGCPGLQRLRRWRWLVWLQSLLLLGWSFCPPWTVWGESVFWTGGTWHIHGNPQTWEGTWSYDDFVPDADGDGLPDEFDPYPAEAHNRSCLFPGGVWAIDGQERYFESAWFDAFDGTLADADGDGLPDLLDPHPQTQHNLSAWFAGGTWVVDGVRCFWEGMWLPCAYESSSLPDTDADGLPDLLDAHPQDAENHSFWFNGGLFTRNDLTLALRAGHYAGSSADANADGLPDSLEDLFLHPSNYGTLQHWPGGTFLINGEWNTYGPVGYFAPEVADRDGDGIPDELDAAADDAWNGSYFEWQGGQFRVHGVLCDFAPGWYGGDSQDADGDGLPNGADPLPSDPDNNSAWWAGGTFLVDGAYQEFPGQWHQANAGDADQDGLPDDLDPYPADAQNPTPEPSFTWAGGTFIIDGAERGFAPGSYAGGWADTDSDLIPDCLDPYPAETANNSEWWSGGRLVVNGVEQTFAAGWHRANAGDADQDGIPEDLDPYPGDSQNPMPAPPQTFYWQGGAFRIHGLEQVFEAGLRDGVWADADGDLLPDSLDPCPGDAANNSAWWPGGTWLVHGLEAQFDARWQRADSPDGDGDGLPDDLDPLPGDPWNGSGWYWPEEPQICLRINDQDHTFTRQLYLTPWADADADGIPDVADPLPQDAYNGNDSDADGLYDSVEVLYPGVLNPQYAQDVLQERADGVSYLRAYEYNWRARDAGRPDLMLALDAPIPAERDSDQDAMSDRFEARHGLNPFDENDAVDSFIADCALNAEKAAWARSPWEPVTPEEYTTVTGQDWSDFATHHIDSLSYAENDWDGDGVSNRDEVLIFRTALRQAASRPTEAALLEAMLAGRVSQTTLLNHQFLLPVQDSCGCSASGCPIQGCYCSNGSCVPVEAAPLPTTPLACGCGYTLMTPSQCGCGSSQSCSPSTPCTPLVLVDEDLPTPACTCPNYIASIGNACGCSRQCFGEMNDPNCRHRSMDCACIFAGLCTSKPPVYDAEGVEIAPGVPCQCGYNCDAGALARHACTCGCSSCPSSTDPATYAKGCPNPTFAPGPNQIKIGNLPCDPVVTVEVVELSPKVKDEEGKEIEGSEKPNSGNPLTPFVEEDPENNRIAHREIKVKIGDVLKDKKVTWTLEALPGATPTTIRGQWEDSETHEDRFEQSTAYTGHWLRRVSQTTSETTIGADGYTAIRVNVPPIGFNQVRIKIQIEGIGTPIDLIDMEVPGVVVIDPGHGGSTNLQGSSANNATANPSGILEKDMALGYGLALRDALRQYRQTNKLNLQVFTTRIIDENSRGDIRANWARDKGADVFVSIHFNATNKQARGSESLIRGTDQVNGSEVEDERLGRRVLDGVLAGISQFDKASNDRGVKNFAWSSALNKNVPSSWAVLSDDSYANEDDYHPVRGTIAEIEFIDVPAVDALLNTGANAGAVKTAVVNGMRDGILNDLIQQPAP